MAILYACANIRIAGIITDINKLVAQYVQKEKNGQKETSPKER